MTTTPSPAETYDGAISVDVGGNPLPILGARAKAGRPRTRRRVAAAPGAT